MVRYLGRFDPVARWKVWLDVEHRCVGQGIDKGGREDAAAFVDGRHCNNREANRIGPARRPGSKNARVTISGRVWCRAIHGCILPRGISLVREPADNCMAEF